jgi:hypothetical protein
LKAGSKTFAILIKVDFRSHRLWELCGFWIVAGMLAAYVVLDGFDLGVGIIYHS